MVRKVATDIGVGADPELFIARASAATMARKTSDDIPRQISDDVPRPLVIVPCVGIVQGTKTKPYTPPYMAKGFAIQEDNVMCEFNVPPASTLRRGKDAIKSAMEMVRRELSMKGLVPYYGKSTHVFDASDLRSDQAREFGCEADFDAYTGGKIRGTPPGMGRTRACGGHIHLGGDFKCPDFVSALFAELFFGVAMDGTYIAARTKSPRKLWYGRPGVFRPKSYGIEYRTPDNTWLKDPWRIETMYDTGLRLARWLTVTPAEELQRIFRQFPWVEQRTFIEHGDAKLKARLLQKANSLRIPL